MKLSKVLLVTALALGSVPLAGTLAQADEKNEHEKTVKLEDIPAPARQTLLREAAGSPIVKVEEEKKDGKTLYEGHVKKGKEMLGIRVDAAGKLIEKHSETEEHEHEKK